MTKKRLLKAKRLQSRGVPRRVAAKISGVDKRSLKRRPKRGKSRRKRS